MNIYTCTNEVLHLFLQMHMGMDLQDTSVGVNRCRPGKIVIACNCVTWHIQCVQMPTCRTVLKGKIKVSTLLSHPRRVMSPRGFFKKHYYPLLKILIILPVSGDFLNGNHCCVTTVHFPTKANLVVAFVGN